MKKRVLQEALYVKIKRNYSALSALKSIDRAIAMRFKAKS
jgi:hypothetical protein